MCMRMCAWATIAYKHSFGSSTCGKSVCIHQVYDGMSVCMLIIMDGERNYSMGSPMDGTPPQSEDR